MDITALTVVTASVRAYFKIQPISCIFKLTVSLDRASILKRIRKIGQDI